MAKVVAYIEGGVVQYIGSNLEDVEVVVIDADNLAGMGYSSDDIEQILARETVGIKDVNVSVPAESETFMEVQPYKIPEPWKPTEGKWCWEEIEGIAEFKVVKFSGYKEGRNYYKFDGVLPMAEVLNHKERIDPADVIEHLKSKGDIAILGGNYWCDISTPVPDAPYGYSVNVWDDEGTMKMTAYAIIDGDDGKRRTSMLHPLANHDFTQEEVELLQKASIAKVAKEARGIGLIEALDELGKAEPKNEPKV